MSYKYTNNKVDDRPVRNVVTPCACEVTPRTTTLYSFPCTSSVGMQNFLSLARWRYLCGVPTSLYPETLVMVMSTCESLTDDQRMVAVRHESRVTSTWTFAPSHVKHNTHSLDDPIPNNQAQYWQMCSFCSCTNSLESTPTTTQSSETISIFHENSKYVCLQLHIHDTFLAIPRSSDDYSLFPFMIMLMILKSIWHHMPTLQQDLQTKNRALESPQDTWPLTDLWKTSSSFRGTNDDNDYVVPVYDYAWFCLLCLWAWIIKDSRCHLYHGYIHNSA